MLFAPAKINISLEIGKKLADGFHEISSEIVKISLGDFLKIDFSEKNPRGKIAIKIKNATGENIKIPPEKNLVAIAIQKFFAEFLPEKNRPDFEIFLEKKIPIGGGLGGGSSDAAATILFLEKHFLPTLSPKKRRNLARKIGADVPLFLEKFSRGKITGRGEIFEKKPPKKMFFCLVRPRGEIFLTGEMFRKFDDFRRKNPAAKTFGEMIFADEKYRKIAEKMEKSGAEKVGVSGSGSVVFGLFQKKSAAKIAEKSFDKNDFWRATAETKKT